MHPESYQSLAERKDVQMLEARLVEDAEPATRVLEDVGEMVWPPVRGRTVLFEGYPYGKGERSYKHPEQDGGRSRAKGVLSGTVSYPAVDPQFRQGMLDEARRIERATPDELEQHQFDAGSMGPKVEAACDFVRRTGERAVIGSLSDLEAMVAGEAGTQFTIE